MTEQQSHPQEQRLATGAINPFAVASVVLGAIGLPAYCTLFLPVSAVVVGVVGASGNPRGFIGMHGRSGSPLPVSRSEAWGSGCAG